MSGRALVIQILRRPKGSRLVSLLCRGKRTGVKAGSLINLCYLRWKSLVGQRANWLSCTKRQDMDRMSMLMLKPIGGGYMATSQLAFASGARERRLEWAMVAWNGAQRQQAWLGEWPTLANKLAT